MGFCTAALPLGPNESLGPIASWEAVHREVLRGIDLCSHQKFPLKGAHTAGSAFCKCVSITVSAGISVVMGPVSFMKRRFSPSVIPCVGSQLGS